MRFRSLIARLLPAEYREQVLGDLHERGLRFHDIASVVPQVWWSHLRRSVGAPTLANASEADLRLRAQQFQFRRLLGICFALALFTQPAWEVQMFWMAVPIALYGLTFFPFSNRMSRPGRDAWVEVHRKHLTHAIQSSRLGSYPASLAVGAVLYSLVRSSLREDTNLELARIAWLVLSLPVSFLVARAHGRRLTRELESLQ